MAVERGGVVPASIQTVLVQMADAEMIAAVSRAPSRADDYRVIDCEDDRSAIRRPEEVKVNFFLWDRGDGVAAPDSALLRSRLAHDSCARGEQPFLDIMLSDLPEQWNPEICALRAPIPDDLAKPVSGT